MKLYLAPGACSLSEHIAFKEAGVVVQPVKVDLKTKRTEHDEDYLAVNPKGYVPALVLDDGQVITENVAILDWLTQRAPALAPQGELARTRLLEMLAFLTCELHKPFLRIFFPTSPAEKEAALGIVAKRLEYLAPRVKGPYLFGDAFTVADAFLFVMLRWARMKGLALPAPLDAYYARVQARPAVAAALHEEALEPV